MHTPIQQVVAPCVSHAEAKARRSILSLTCRVFLVFLALAVLLLPCWWQTRIQAGDLSSHIYNAWLTTQIEQGRVQGLQIVWQGTNVLFDWMLLLLLKTVGVNLAQKIAVSVTVLVFSSGAFALIAAMSRRKPWFTLPVIAILAYGWVFYTGLFNFYLSVGFCLGALACLWNPASRLKLWSIPLLVLAIFAHALPVAWLIGIVAYVTLARSVRPRRRVVVLFASICMLIALRFFLIARYQTQHRFPEITTITGANQVDLFGSKYVFLVTALMAFWALLLIVLRRQIGWRRIILDVRFQLAFLTAAGVVLVPSAILLPGYKHGLVFIAERMSLITAVLVTAALARARPAKWMLAMILIIAGLFWAWNYQATAHINTAEDQIEQAVSGLPPGSRVISTFLEPGLGVLPPLSHAVDRACIGRCFSFADYEPSTAQFRIRVTDTNSFAVSSYEDFYAMQMGTYVVRASDPPLYQVQWCDARKVSVCVRLLKVGEINGQGATLGRSK
jgi:hypothetical protein